MDKKPPMNLLRRFKPTRVKRIKSQKGKKNAGLSTEHKFWLIEQWKKEGVKISRTYYRELLFLCVDGKKLLMF